MTLPPMQEAFLESWLKKRKEGPLLPKRKPPATNRKGQNPKWNDDAWFEKRYGDPYYYKRVKGLN